AAVAPPPATGSPLPPGPRTPRLWQSLSYALRPYATAESAYRWGDRYTIDALATLGKLVVFSDPEGIRDVFGGDGDTLRAGEASGVGGRRVSGAARGLALDPRPRGGAASARAAPDEPAVPRRAHARLRPSHARHRPARHRSLAGRPGVSDPSRDAVDHARRDHPRGVRRRSGGAVRPVPRPGGAVHRASERAPGSVPRAPPLPGRPRALLTLGAVRTQPRAGPGQPACR